MTMKSTWIIAAILVAGCFSAGPQPEALALEQAYVVAAAEAHAWAGDAVLYWSAAREHREFDWPVPKNPGNLQEVPIRSNSGNLGDGLAQEWAFVFIAPARATALALSSDGKHLVSRAEIRAWDGGVAVFDGFEHLASAPLPNTGQIAAQLRSAHPGLAARIAEPEVRVEYHLDQMQRRFVVSGETPGEVFRATFRLNDSSSEFLTCSKGPTCQAASTTCFCIEYPKLPDFIVPGTATPEGVAVPDCGTPTARCTVHEFELDWKARASFELTWTLATNQLDLVLLQGQTRLSDADAREATTSRTLEIELEPGNYTIQVVPTVVAASDDWILAAKFSHSNLA